MKNPVILILILCMSISSFKKTKASLSGAGQTMADNTVLQDSLQVIEENVTSSLLKYRQQLELLRNEFSGADMPGVKFFLFGMGNRTKLLYKSGKLINSITGKVVHEWQVKSETIIPNDYQVNIETLSAVKVIIFENEKGVFINDKGKETLIAGTETPLLLPAFEEYKYSEVLKELHHEILINIVDSKPLPNYFVYKNPWRRDGAMMAMCLKETGNLGLIRNWALSLNDPYDRNNAGETEADNLGQTLYILSFFTDKNNTLVAKILEETQKYEVSDGRGKYIKGHTDFHEAPVYQTKWLKYGLKALNLPDDYTIPMVQDDYSVLFWWDYKDSYMPGTIDTYNIDKYPYLGWACDNFHGKKTSPVSNRDYPLTWEIDASQADYNGMAIVDEIYVTARNSSPHTWHASEVFLYLLKIK
jgi:hypothetical protein